VKPAGACHNTDVKKLDFIFFDAGGGHRAAANALAQVIEQQGYPFQVRLLNLQESLDEIDIFRKTTGLRLQDVYNLMLKKGWTLGSAQLTAAMHVLIRLFHSRQVRTLERMWQARQPDMVVSLVPNFARAIAGSLHSVLPGVPLATVLTDIADYPPHFWIEPGLDQHWICGSAKAVAQAAAMGYSAERIHRVSGMILNPSFHDLAPLTPEERAEQRAKLGFNPFEPVGLVLFGGQGASVMFDIARSLAGRQLILICGHNAKLAARLRKLQHPAPIFVEGFTKQVPRYMQLADYLIGKPGPGSLSEAVALRLPVIVEHNAWTLPQERYNAEWVRESKLGLVLPDFRGIGAAVDSLLERAAYSTFRASAAAQNNRAVFEIPVVLQKIAGA
jgi:UDP-N-acetylglucosamine:LPS N-acetylglucosamine transferase